MAISIHSSPQLQFVLDKDNLTVYRQGELLALSDKWVVFYTLLALNTDRYISPDDLCDHHPWTRLTPSIVGRDLWRFVRLQEPRFFGETITKSPPRQATKQFTLCPEVAEQVSFYPDRTSVADHLRSLQSHRNNTGAQVNECALLFESGLVPLALERLSELRSQCQNINERAKVEVLITICLSDLHGLKGSAQQLQALHELLDSPDLNRINQAGVLLRLARHHTLCGDYEQAAGHFARLRNLLRPKDGVDYCAYHINYGLFLRRIGQLEQAIYHQRLADDVAQMVQWWHGVHSCRHNLALMFLSLAQKSPALAREKYLRQAQDWATKAHTIAILNRQAIKKAEAALLLAQIHRELQDPQQARHWLEVALLVPSHPDHDQHLLVVYQERALLEQAYGNLFLAQVAREKALEHQHKASAQPEPTPSFA